MARANSGTDCSCSHSSSFWHRDIIHVEDGECEPHELFDIAVIGGGLSGASLLYWITQRFPPTTKVLLLERKCIASGATGRNGGHLKALNKYEQSCAEEMIKLLQTNQLSEATELFIHSENPIKAQIHPAKLVLELVRLSQTLNENICVLTDSEVSTIAPVRYHGRELRFIHTLDREFITKAVVYCTNGLTSKILPQLKSTIVPTRAQCFASKPLDTSKLIFNTNSNYDDGAVYIIQRVKDGRLIAGGYRSSVPGEEWNLSNDGEINDQISKNLRDWLVKDPRVSGTKVEVETEWTGIMGFTPDSLPLVGCIHPFGYICAGFNGHGMPVCFWAAKQIANELSSALLPNSPLSSDSDLEDFTFPFSPSRFSQVPASKL